MKQHKIGLGFAFGVALGIAAPGLAQEAVQWRVEDGGNGHWYAIRPASPSFYDAKVQSEQIGAYLSTITSEAEQQFIYASVALGASFLEAWFGLVQATAAPEPAGGWLWITGEPLGKYSNWWNGVPQPDDNACGMGYEEDFGMWSKQWGGKWADLAASPKAGPGCYSFVTHAVLEWSADCNGDGIVDYGQILDGTFEDLNDNGIPDICEVDPCPGDVVESGSVNGIDLAAILANWGTSGQKFPRSDANGDGTVDANDLAIVLSGWGNCP